MMKQRMASFLTSQAISFYKLTIKYIMINKLLSSQTIIKFQSHQKPSNNFNHHYCTMEHIIQHLQENTDHDNEYYITEDQDDDNNFFEPHDRYDDNNSNCTYIVNTILSNIARLNVHLPIATILVFTNFAPFLTNSGKCTTLDRWLMGGFTGFLAASCVFVSITDSFRTATGGLYYGVATFHGIWKFGGGRARPCVLSDYKLRWGDLFYASLSLIVFLVFVLVQNDVLSCYDVVLPRKFINLAPLVIGFVVSLLFVLFPSSRRGIGHPFLLHTDGLHTRC